MSRLCWPLEIGGQGFKQDFPVIRRHGGQGRADLGGYENRVGHGLAFTRAVSLRGLVHSHSRSPCLDIRDRPGHVSVPRLVAALRQPVRHVNVPRSVYFHPRTRPFCAHPVPDLWGPGMGLCAIQRTPRVLTLRRYPGEASSRGRPMRDFTSSSRNRHRSHLRHSALRCSRG
jgi:hypothetical protein